MQPHPRSSLAEIVVSLVSLMHLLSSYREYVIFNNNENPIYYSCQQTVDNVKASLISTRFGVNFRSSHDRTQRKLAGAFPESANSTPARILRKSVSKLDETAHSNWKNGHKQFSFVPQVQIYLSLIEENRPKLKFSDQTTFTAFIFNI